VHPSTSTLVFADTGWNGVQEWLYQAKLAEAGVDLDFGRRFDSEARSRHRLM
jgi:hypothetical protein